MNDRTARLRWLGRVDVTFQAQSCGDSSSAELVGHKVRAKRMMLIHILVFGGPGNEYGKNLSSLAQNAAYIV